MKQRNVISDLSSEHPMVKAAHDVARSYHNHETMIPALKEAAALFNMWIAVNACSNPNFQKNGSEDA